MILILSRKNLAPEADTKAVFEIEMTDFFSYLNQPIQLADLVAFTDVEDGFIKLKLLKNRDGWCGNYKFQNKKEFQESAVFAFVMKQISSGGAGF